MNFSEIIDKEREMLLSAGEKYGEHFRNSFNFVVLMQDFIVDVRPEAWIFALFLSQVRKHLVLSFFSVLRQHHIQAMLDLRQVFEAGAKGAYAIAFPDENIFVQKNDTGTLFEPKGLPKECYRWLEENYPEGTLPLKNLKNIINESCAHANAIFAFPNFEMTKGGRRIEFAFFDKEDADLVKVDLWFVGNTAMGLMDLFYGVNQKQNLITFTADFVLRLKNYEAAGKGLKAELMGKQRFSRFNYL